MLYLIDYTTPQEIIENYMGHDILVFSCKDRQQIKETKADLARAIVDYGYAVHKEETDRLQVRGTTLQFMVGNERERTEDKGFLFLMDFSFLREATYSCGEQTHTVKEYSHNETGMEFVLISGGTFMMGSESGYSDEKPVRKVTLTPYLIAKYQCTQAIWKKVMGSNPSYFKDGNRPMETVSWNDCQEFCEKTGLQLPTEAQWEYACRAGSTGKYCFGDDEELKEYAWYYMKEYAWSYKNSGDESHPVGQKLPNAYGLYDMYGNVWEWCQDFYGEYTEKTSKTSASFCADRGRSLGFRSAEELSQVNPTGPVDGYHRVVRGGSWNNYACHCTSALRHGDADAACNLIGARVVSRLLPCV